MTEQDIKKVPGVPEPGPENFDFEAWLEGEATFPEFEHTAFLDQKSGVELARVEEEIEELVSEQSDLEKRIETRRQEASGAFVDMLLDSMLSEHESLTKHLEMLLKKREELREKIKKSAVTLYFQVKTPEELGTVTREATRQFHAEMGEKFAKASENDMDMVTARSRYTLTAQIAHFCTGMTLHRTGAHVPPPTRQGADSLLRKLISSEVMRLMESIGTGLSASQEWADKIDAGFPGRSADVEDVRLDQDGTEDSKVVGPAPAHHADREALSVD